jgi:hypothetical protein
MAGRARVRRSIACLLVAALAGGALPAAGQGARRFSGRVERVDLTEGILVVESLGSRGRPERHAVHIGPDTPIVSAARRRAHEIRGVHAYAEVPVELVDVLTGDFVVVETAVGLSEEVALRVTIVEPPATPVRR